MRPFQSSREGGPSLMKQACVLLAAMMLVGGNEALPTTGFEEYALQSCLSDCYATFRPSKRLSDYSNCVGRCRRIYESSKQKGVPGTRRW